MRALNLRWIAANPGVRIENPDRAVKSYPDFLRELDSPLPVVSHLGSL